MRPSGQLVGTKRAGECDQTGGRMRPNGREDATKGAVEVLLVWVNATKWAVEPLKSLGGTARMISLPRPDPQPLGAPPVWHGDT